MKGIMTPFRVGLLVIAGAAAFFVLMSVLARPRYDDERSYRVVAFFRDATGLGPRSRVQIAGIEVGLVEDITLTPDARAMATLRIRNDVALREDAVITKRSASLLGDFLLDVYPGSPDKPKLKSGDIVGRVVTQAGPEDVFAALGDVTRDIGKVTRNLAELVASDEVGSVRQIIRQMNDLSAGLGRTVERSGERLDAILQNVEALSEDARGLARGQENNIEQILANVRTFTAQANRIADALARIVGTGEGELKDSVASVRGTLDELRTTLQQAQQGLKTAQAALDSTKGTVESARGTVEDVNAIMGKVRRGEGTLGRLVNDDAIAKKVDKLLADTNGLLATVSQLQTHVQLREELHFGGALKSPAGKAGLQIRFAPRPDKHYGVELVSDPRGKVERQTVKRVSTTPETPATEEQIVTTTSDYKVSAWFGKRLGPATLRAGLIESTGGFGADLHAWKDRLRFTVDAFDWSNPDAKNFRLRAGAHVSFFDHVFVGVGVDDALNGSCSGSSAVPGCEFFANGGLQFTDDDLKTLLTIVGAPSVAP